MDISNLYTFLSFFIPLYCAYQLASVAGIFSERSGVANVAIEGNMILGAVIYAIFFEQFSINWGFGEFESIAFAVIIATLLSSIYMLLLANITNRYMGDHIIVGTGMNLLAPAMAFLLYYSFSGKELLLDPSSIQFVYENNYIGETPLLWTHLAFVIFTALVILVSLFILNRTKFGLRLKTSGENPYALETAGVSVANTRTKALWIAGLLSSLAGIAFTMRYPTRENFWFTVNGSGFIAIGIMILGQYRILGTVIGSLVFAFLISIFNVIPFVSNNHFLLENQNLMKAIPFVIPLIGLMVFRKSYVPKAVGKNFRKDQR